MDEGTRGDERSTLEMPEILRDLSELVSRAMAICRAPSHAGELELAAIEITVRILTRVIDAVEVRDVQMGMRHLDSAFARARAERERGD